MEKFGGFSLTAFWGTREVLGLVGKEDSKHKCSEPHQGWTIVNKDTFLPALVVGSFIKVPHGHAPVCLVTL